MKVQIITIQTVIRWENVVRGYIPNEKTSLELSSWKPR